LTLRLYLDDSAASRQLSRLLREAQHEVTVPADMGLAGADDEEHFAYARAHNLVLLTKDTGDFPQLYQDVPDHPGLLLVYRDNDARRDMHDADIVRAVANLQQAGVPIAGAMHVLNHWQY
jgi:predicted nuclease of predicted toxin-antitoxin system